ncbi:hypothetical protein TD95_004011 [Thielaviopsis punctulata]|uniref:Ubiquitin-like protease family profile domain-containing protein n=1 Tax=Thielaviopsis punctulata TaxID=72032 RepID=A0A0F4Z6E2_9PEZI|nr:hypothetical protein TD95_004011 [Thielaviopsis punctulata]
MSLAETRDHSRASRPETITVSADEIAACAERIGVIDRHLEHLGHLLTGPCAADVRRLPGGLERYMDADTEQRLGLTSGRHSLFGSDRALGLSSGRSADPAQRARLFVARETGTVRSVLVKIYTELPLYLHTHSPVDAAVRAGLGHESVLERVAAFLLGLPEISRRVGMALATAEVRSVRDAGGDVRDVLAGEWPASFVRPREVESGMSAKFVPVVPATEGDALRVRNEWAFRSQESSSDDEEDEEEKEEEDYKEEDHDEVRLVPDADLFSCAEYIPSAQPAFPTAPHSDSDDGHHSDNDDDHDDNDDNETSAALKNLSLHISSPALQQITAAKEAAAKQAALKQVAADRALRLAGTLRAPRRASVFPPSSSDSARLAAQLAAALRGDAGGLQFPVSGPETGLTAHDFETLVPARAWLNDAVVDSALSWLDRFANAGVPGYPKAAERRVLVLGSFFFATLVKSGGRNTERALRRKGVTPAWFAQLETVLIPVCQNSHWTLLVVQPCARRVVHMDSLNPRGSPRLRATLVRWLGELLRAEGVAEDEWREVDVAAPVQTNGYDCGVFTVMNAICMVIGVEPGLAYVAEEMARYRWDVAAMLVNQGFSGDFDLEGL